MSQSVSSGTIFLMVSEISFILSNYAIHIGLARYLGPEAYGIFGILTSLYLINRSFLNTGLPRAVSKFLSEFPDKASSILKTASRVQWVIALIFALFYLGFAPFIARILHDESLTWYIMFLGIMVVPLALLSLYTGGFLNGLHLFREQAYIKTVYPILRLVFTIILVVAGWALWGALIGYFLAIIVALLWSKYLVQKIIKRQKALFPWKKIISFALPVTVASLAFTLLRNLNVLFLKALLNDNYVIGLYTAAYILSTATFMIFLSLPLTLTPAISRALAAQDLEKVRRYCRESLRYLLLLLLPITAFIMATAPELLNLFYSSAYESAGKVLILLTISSAFLSIFSIFGSFVTGSGDPKREMYWLLLLAAALAGLNLLLIPRYGMVGSAWASLITALAAMLLAGRFVHTKFKFALPWASLLRIFIITSLIFIFAHFWHYSGLALLINFLVLGAVYIILLYLFGELGMKEINLIKKVLKNRPSQTGGIPKEDH